LTTAHLSPSVDRDRRPWKDPHSSPTADPKYSADRGPQADSSAIRRTRPPSAHLCTGQVNDTIVEAAAAAGASSPLLGNDAHNKDHVT